MLVKLPIELSFYPLMSVDQIVCACINPQYYTVKQIFKNRHWGTLFLFTALFFGILLVCLSLTIQTISFP